MTRLVVVRSWTLPSIEIYLVMNDFSQYEDLAIFHKWKKNRGGGGVALKNMPNLSWFDHFGLCYSL